MFPFWFEGYPGGYPATTPTYTPNLYQTGSPGYPPGEHQNPHTWLDVIYVLIIRSYVHSLRKEPKKNKASLRLSFYVGLYSLSDFVGICQKVVRWVTAWKMNAYLFRSLPAHACMVEIKVHSVLFGQGSCERSNHLLHFLKTLYSAIWQCPFVNTISFAMI